MNVMNSALQQLPEYDEIRFDASGFRPEELLGLYQQILFPRMVEEKMLILLRQGRISKWFSGIGQEAIAVGATLALESHDYIYPLHRNLGVFTARDLPLKRLIAQWQAKTTGYTHGRDRSFHFGDPESRIIGMISHLGAMLGVACGTALASNLSEAQGVSLAFMGDGGTSEGDFHEAVNLAAVWDLPVIFLIENNGYGLSTPTHEQYRCKHLVDRAIGYGIEGYRINGNDILEVYRTFRNIARRMREDPKPVLIEAMTFRMRGHEEASGVKYVPKNLMEAWAKLDPVVNFENFLLEHGSLTTDYRDQIRARYKQEIEDAVEEAFAEPDAVSDPAHEIASVYAPVDYVTTPRSGGRPIRYIDAITEALKQSMELNPQLVLMGQDIAEYGGAFKITQGFVELFGKPRVRNTPLCESAIVACAMGLGLEGYSAMMEMQFADFATCGFNQIINNLAKTYYRWDFSPPVVIRMPTGGGTGAGPFHSQSNEAWFFHTPGLKVVYPATAHDAKGLLNTALLDASPVIFFEHKALYRSVTDEVPEEYYTLPIGSARIDREGDDLTIVTYGATLYDARKAADAHPDTSIEIIDLRSLLPWDRETVFASVQKTGKCLVLHEDTLTGGIGAEIAAEISEHCFRFIDAPVVRVASLDTPVPFSTILEKDFLPAGRLQKKLEDLLAW
jgi:2-oxoisovalerate dehydrogenase E1 component